MNKSVIKFATVIAVTCSANALAQGAPMLGLGMLASNASASSGLGGNTLIEPSDGGGGSTGGHAMRGVDGDLSHSPQATSVRSLPDALPTKMAVHSNHSAASTTAVAKPASYRWQSLVPGAIK